MAGEYINEVIPFAASLMDSDRYMKLLEQLVYPSLHGVHVLTFESLDEPGKVVGAIVVPGLLSVCGGYARDTRWVRVQDHTSLPAYRARCEPIGGMAHFREKQSAKDTTSGNCFVSANTSVLRANLDVPVSLNPQVKSG